MKSQKSFLYCKLFIYTLLISFLPVSFCQAGNKFKEPFVLKTKFGNSIKAIEINFDEDLRGEKILIYTTIEGKEGFLNPKNLENGAELNEFIASGKLNSSPQTNHDKDTPPYIPPSGKVNIPPGMLGKYLNYLEGKNFYLSKKDGTKSDRTNDIEELCKDYVFYRGRILKYAKQGNNKKADKARRSFQQINRWLNEYQDNDVEAMFSYLNL